MSSSPLDCVVIGYHDGDFQQLAAAARAKESMSPFYSELKRGSGVFQGERLPYMELLNASARVATGVDPKHHVCQLPPLGVLTLVSYLRARGFTAEPVGHFDRELEQLEALLAQNPRTVAITTTFYVDADPIAEVAAFVRERCPDAKIIVGGPHIYNICSDYDDITQNYLLANMGGDIYIFDSQGENALAGLMGALRNGGDYSAVPNLIYQNGDGKFSRTLRVVEDNPLDSTQIDWNSFDRSFFTPSAQMRTARSCAFKCAFCRYPAVAGPLATHEVDVVEAQLRTLSESGAERVIFIDDTFNVPLPRFKDLCRMMVKEKIELDWYSYFRCSNADEEAFDLMAAAGCKGVFLGVESGDEQMLENMNKKVKVKKYLTGIQALAARDITTHTSLIVGYPGETEQTIQNTIDFINESKPTFFNAGIWFYEPKAPVAERCEEFGIQGDGMTWKHNSMGWQEADGLVDRLYESVTGSTILPTYMFDFWGIPYLEGRGVPVERLRGFAKVAEDLLIAGLTSEESSPDLDQKLVKTWD